MAIRILVRAVGAASAMETIPEVALEEVRAALQPSEVLVKNDVVGVNYIDTYFRSGLYSKQVPFTPGQEGAGVIIAAGAEAASRVGQRVIYGACIDGSYRWYARVKSRDAYAVPEGVPLDVACTLPIQGCTAHYLACDSYPTKPGDVVLVHAAAGGVGLLLTQMCRARGATVIGVCRGTSKVALARDIGKCDIVLDSTETPDIVAAVRAQFPQGVHCVYDGVGKVTFEQSLKCLRPRGVLVSFGNASGAIDPIAPLVLSTHGSLYLHRPKLGDFMLTEEEANGRVSDVFSWIQSGKLNVHIGQRFPLKDAVACHEALEGRGTTGKIVLTVE